MGKAETEDWYRINFRNGFGWIFSSTAEVADDCAGLRLFPNHYGPENPDRYDFIGDPVDMTKLQGLLSPTPEVTQQAIR